MPMFLTHIAVSAGFIALVIGTAFLLWLKKQEVANGFAKLVAYLTILFSISGLVCTTYYAVRYWKDGYFKAPMIMSHDPKDIEAMHKMMPGMMDRMKNNMGEKNMPGMPLPPATPQEHEEHHE